MLYLVRLILGLNFKHAQIKLLRAVKKLFLVEKKRQTLKSERAYLMKTDLEMNTKIQQYSKTFKSFVVNT